MGRHSAPDDASAVVSAGDPAVVPAASARGAGRHARADTEDEPARLDNAIELDLSILSLDSGDDSGRRAARRLARRQARHAAQRARRGRESNTRADLRLLRENPALRVRCLAAVVVSFLLYTFIIMALGRTADYLLWIWIPAIVAGGALGAFLDVAHRPVDPSAAHHEPVASGAERVEHDALSGNGPQVGGAHSGREAG